jgi:outer membrane protein W
MRLSLCSIALAASLLAACSAFAQTNDEKQEFAVTVGALSGSNPNATTGGPLTLGSGVAFQVNYARKFDSSKQWASLFWEVNVLANPYRHLGGVPTTATSQIRSFYVTPGVRLQFAPQERITPFLDAGAGYAFYTSSENNIAGGATPSSGNTNTYAVDFGGGVDIVASKRYVIRGDVRGFYTGSPNFGTPVNSGQFNFVIGGGVVWKFGK